ncbi:hypothetical protein SAMN04487859_10735 [Roseovarius lutimaris]|uniref:Uncharacterized protein n=1 Tax=Roseovarius lutimaris TaxID=1005928 RepID=A0A1I5B2Z6_9RHOB|nr:hypothetical protein SAMN04487859_10735 [Roseovarius lutimaris]
MLDFQKKYTITTAVPQDTAKTRFSLVKSRGKRRMSGQAASLLPRRASMSMHC